jgi:hypothetical protein
LDFFGSYYNIREKMYNTTIHQPFNLHHKKYCINNRNILNNLIKTARKTSNKKQIELAGNN